MSEKHYLVWRDRDGLRRIEVYKDQALALEQYELAEWRIFTMLEGKDGDLEVCLFGADSLATLCRTHASWVAARDRLRFPP